jgi:hypothetical protein
MPYITQTKRDMIGSFERIHPADPGELNYAITTLVHQYMKDQESGGRRHGYTLYNEVLGVLEAAKLELYRRHIAPF